MPVAQPYMDVALCGTLETKTVERLAATCNDILSGSCTIEARHHSTTKSGKPELRFWSASLLDCRAAFTTLIERGAIEPSMAPSKGEFVFTDGVRVAGLTP